MTSARTQANSRLQDALQKGVDPHAPILIAGGGIGGLALALALARRGIDSHVLERRAAFGEQGAGIQIGPNGTRILHDLGVADDLRAHVGEPQHLIVHGMRTGSVLARLPLNADMAQRFGSPYWAAHREDLHAALLKQVRAQPKIMLTMGAGIGAVASDARGAAIELGDWGLLAGPVVVGADGLHSSLRTHVDSGVWPTPSGKTAYRAVLPADAADAALADGNTHIWLGPDAHVVHYAVRGGAEMAVVVIVKESFAGELWNHEADFGPVLARLSLAPPLRTLLGAPQAWQKWALSPLNRLPPMTRGRVALLGDAAHPMLPFLAQGGVMALEDAVVLADALADRDDAGAALQVYRRQRERRVRRVVATSKRNGAIYHLSGVAAAARNAVMKHTPAERLMRGYDWIYGWKA